MMESFYFQLMSGIFGTLITGFIGWMAINTWRMTNKVAAFDERFKGLGEDITAISNDVRELRKYDAMLASHAVQIGGLDRRISEITHKKRERA